MIEGIGGLLMGVARSADSTGMAHDGMGFARSLFGVSRRCRDRVGKGVFLSGTNKNIKVKRAGHGKRSQAGL